MIERFIFDDVTYNDKHRSTLLNGFENVKTNLAGLTHSFQVEFFTLTPQDLLTSKIAALTEHFNTRKCLIAYMMIADYNEPIEEPNT